MLHYSGHVCLFFCLAMFVGLANTHPLGGQRELGGSGCLVGATTSGLQLLDACVERLEWR